MSNEPITRPGVEGLRLPPEMFKGFIPEPGRWYELSVRVQWRGDGLALDGPCLTMAPMPFVDGGISLKSLAP